MKRSTLAAAVVVPASVLVTGAASALMVGTPAPTVPQPASVVDTIEETLAGAGLPVDLPALPELPALASTVPVPSVPALPGLAAAPVPALPDVGAVVAPVAGPVVDALAGAGLPVDDVLGAVPLAEPAADDAGVVIATVEDTLSGLGVPVDLPAAELGDLAVLPAVESVVATVTDTVAGLGLPLGGLLGGR